MSDNRYETYEISPVLDQQRGDTALPPARGAEGVRRVDRAGGDYYCCDFTVDLMMDASAESSTAEDAMRSVYY